MDEITIGDKTYVSSKQAAKITGYAKDYVGQLCREGRVEARLVGRNWYVLDSAIREHRFGKEEEEKPVIPAADTEVDRVSTWQKPQYVAETPILVPNIAAKQPDTVGSPAIADMQSAWREWFEEKKAPQAALPDGSEDFKDEYLPLVLPETPEEKHEPVHVALESKAEESEMVVVSRIRHQPEAVLEGENELEGGSKVELHRSYTTTTTPRREYEEDAPIVEIKPSLPKVAAARPQTPVVAKRSSSVTIKALLIVLSVIAVLTAVIGTGNAEQLLSGTSLDFGAQKEVIDFLGGKSTYESSL